MALWEWVWTLVGAVLVLSVLLDIFLVVLHLDLSGLIAPMLHRGIWNLVVSLSRRFRRMRRRLLALAGPLMMVALFFVWLGLFVLGFAMIIWPHLENYRAADEIRMLAFTDALYFSGVTATVLGYGDITPLTPAQRILSIVESGLGFALLTGIVAYLLTVLNSVTRRNAMALRLWSGTNRTGDGVQLVLRYLSTETYSDIRGRFERAVDALNELQEVSHQFPILDLYYRSRQRSHDPEPMLQTLAEMAVVGLVLTRGGRARCLRPAAEELADAITQVMQRIAAEYMERKIQDRLEHPQPGDTDRRCIEEIRRRLHTQLDDEMVAENGSDATLLDLAYRARTFLTELDHFTGWQMDHEARCLARKIE